MHRPSRLPDDGYDRVDFDEWEKYNEQQNVLLFWQIVVVVITLILAFCPS